VRASFFVAMGPDNSGKAVIRAFRRRGFVGKMVRTNAIRMYGLRTALSGTLLPARLVGAGRPDRLRQIADAGHEIGVHGWDHTFWQDHLLDLPPSEAAAELRKAATFFEGAVGRPPDCASAPAWVMTAAVLEEEVRLRLRFASDTRGSFPFRPRIGGLVSPIPQVPTTLPTLDEAIGLDGTRERNFAESIVARARESGRDAVFTLHAEAEGMSYRHCFEEILARLRDAGAPCVPCGALLEGVRTAELPASNVVMREVPGRAGLLACQGEPTHGY